MWDESTLQMLLQGVGETLYMTLGSTLFAYVIGLPLGVLLVMCASDGIRPHPVLYKILDVVVNLTRSFPFIILLIAVLPFTRWLLGTTLGPTAVIVAHRQLCHCHHDHSWIYCDGRICRRWRIRRHCHTLRLLPA